MSEVAAAFRDPPVFSDNDHYVNLLKNLLYSGLPRRTSKGKVLTYLDILLSLKVGRLQLKKLILLII
jgi:hypothetical protein